VSRVGGQEAESGIGGPAKWPQGGPPPAERGAGSLACRLSPDTPLPRPRQVPGAFSCPGGWSGEAGPGGWSGEAGPGRLVRGGWSGEAGPGGWSGEAGPGRLVREAGPGRLVREAGPFPPKALQFRHLERMPRKRAGKPRHGVAPPLGYPYTTQKRHLCKPFNSRHLEGKRRLQALFAGTSPGNVARFPLLSPISGWPIAGPPCHHKSQG